MIKNSVQHPHVKRIFFILTTLLLVIGFTAFLVKNRNFKTHAYSPDLFVTRWQTDVDGATEPTKVTLSFLKAATNSYDVYWNCDDDYETFKSNLAEHTYPTAGTYDICIRSTTPLAFYAPGLDSNKKEKDKLLEIKQWGDIQWSSFARAFQGMKNMQLTATDVPDLSKVTNMSSAFEVATNFTGHESMSRWNTSNVNTLQNTFRDATNFNAPIGSWNTGKVTNMSGTFQNASAFNQNINNWNTEKVINMNFTFGGASSFNQPIGKWNTGIVNNMAGMFMGASSFNQDINDWNTESVKKMGYMFLTASSFNKPIGKWNTENVDDMGRMFNGASSFNQPISDWNVSKVTNMRSMFNSASSFNQNISTWNPEKIQNMGLMFYGATSFNNGQASGESTAPISWNTASLTNIAGMFQGASVFNQPLSLNVGGVSNMSNVFNNAILFNQPLSHWDTSSATSMQSMFQKAYAFNQDISDWNIGTVGNFVHVLSNSGMQPDNYDKLLNSWSNKTEKQGLTFRADKVYYCNPEPGRSKLINTNKWTIYDAGQKCPPQNLNLSPNQIDEGKTTVGTITSISDGAVTYSCVSGEGSEDNTKFDLDSDTGILAFLVAPDYENPTGQADPEDANKYTIRVRATDTSNNLYSEAVFIITVIDVDEVPPVINISDPETKISRTPITTTFTVTDHFSVNSVEVDGSSTATGNNLVCNPTFPRDNSSSNPEDNLILNCTIDVTSSGKLVLKATDKAGHSSTESMDGYVIDTVKPNITISPVTKIKNDDITDTRITVTDDVGIYPEDIQIASSSQDMARDLVCTPDTGNPNIVNCTITIIDSGDLAIEATDKVGNSFTKYEYGYIIDKTKPNVSITSTAPINIANASHYNLEGTCTYGDNSVVTVIADQSHTTECLSDNTWSMELNLSTQLDGTVTINTSQTDVAGNEGKATKDLTKDTIAPIIVNEAFKPADNQSNPTNQQPIIFHTTFSEPLKDNTLTAEDFQIKEDGVITTAQVTNITSISSTKYALSVSGIVSQNASITVFSPANTYQDVLGNWNTTEVESSAVTFDTEQPDVTIEERKPNAKYLDPTNLLNNPEDTDFRFNVTFSKEINTDTLSIEDFSITGGTYTDAQVSIIDNSNAIVIFKPTQDATYTVTLPTGRVSDLAGNLNNVSTSLDNQRTYDTTSPTVTINQADDQVDPTNVNEIKFTIVFSEPINGDTFAKEDLVIEGSSTATVSQLQTVNSTTYTAIVTGMVSGETVSLSLPADKVEDPATNQNEVSSFTDNSVTYIVEEEKPEQPDEPEEEKEEPPKSIIPTLLNPKPVIKPKNPFTKYINPITEQKDTTHVTKEATSEITKKPTPPTQSKSLKIKVYNASKEPMQGVTVEIHSDIRTGVTDENGEVYFEGLDTGLHTMVIAYNGYRAEKKINLVSDGEEEMEINIKLEKVIIPTYVYWLVVLIILLTILLGYNIYKRKQTEKK